MQSVNFILFPEPKTTSSRILNLPSITLTDSIDVFEHILGTKFGLDVASKAIALSGGNLIMAHKFLGIVYGFVNSFLLLIVIAVELLITHHF